MHDWKKKLDLTMWMGNLVLLYTQTHVAFPGTDKKKEEQGFQKELKV